MTLKSSSAGDAGRISMPVYKEKCIQGRGKITQPPY